MRKCLECEKNAHARGLCRSCYTRRTREGTLPPKKTAPKIKCSGDGCDALVTGASGLCGDCYQKDGRDPFRQRRSKYGITQEQYNELLAEQGGGCAICGVSGVKMCIDHDHHSGRVRGVLCNGCNWGIGHFKDEPKLLARAMVYLEDSAWLKKLPAAGEEEDPIFGVGR